MLENSPSNSSETAMDAFKRCASIENYCLGAEKAAERPS
jgi:hypothetical protein